jgi:hypothetical protein
MAYCCNVLDISDSANVPIQPLRFPSLVHVTKSGAFILGIVFGSCGAGFLFRCAMMT